MNRYRIPVATLLLLAACDLEPTSELELQALDASAESPAELDASASTRDPGLDDSDEHEGTPQPQHLTMRWVGVDGGHARLDRGEPPALALALDNPNDHAVEAEVYVSADRGTSAPPELLATELALLAAGQGDQVDVSLRALADVESLTAHSGALSVYVRACLAGSDHEADCQWLQPEGLYFHRDAEQGDFRVYDHDTLISRYRAGDLRGAAAEREDVDEGERAAPDRVVAYEPATTPTGDARVFEPVSSDSLETGAGAPSAARATKKTICLRIDVRNTDSGVADYTGRTEDQWTGSSRVSPNYYNVLARGVRARVYDSSDGSYSYYWAGESGCFDHWSASASPTLDVSIYTRAQDVNGNIVRVHDGEDDTSSWAPGQLWYKTVTGVSVPGTTVYVDFDGRSSGQTKWTVLATAAHTLYRYHDGISNKTLSVGFLPSTDSCWRSSSSYNSSVQYIESDDAHLVRLSTCDQSMHLRKFLLSHELGHAIARLYYDKDGFDSPKNQGYPSGAGPCDQGADDSSYATWSSEYTSVNFVEGFAHFVSTSVWNNRDAYATFNWFGDVYQAEFYDLSLTGGIHQYGGRINNICQLAAAGVSTNNDWLRAYWDFYSYSGCGTTISQQDMLRWYKQVRDNDDDGTKTLTFNNFHIAADIALDSIGALSSCERDAARYMLDWNGCGGTSMGYAN